MENFKFEASIILKDGKMVNTLTLIMGGYPYKVTFEEEWFLDEEGNSRTRGKCISFQLEKWGDENGYDEDELADIIDTYDALDLTELFELHKEKLEG